MNAESLAQASDGFLSFLLYLVIAVIWVAGKFMQQREARRKVEDLKRRREEREREAQQTGRPPAREASPTVMPPPPPNPRSLEDDLQDFLGRMTGLTKEDEPPPPPPPPPPPKMRPVLQFDQAPPPPPVPSKRPQAYGKPAAKRVDADVDAMESYAKIEDIEDIAELELDPDKASFGGPDLLMNVRAMMIDMSRASVRIPTVRIPTMRMVHTKTAKPDLGDTDTLKHAIVSGILLNPPKALNPDPFHQDPGQL
jgi:hypothetical protein